MLTKNTARGAPPPQPSHPFARATHRRVWALASALLFALPVQAQQESAPAPSSSASPRLEHSPKKLLELSPFDATHRDSELLSPKSALFHPTKQKLYINALEAGKTLVYSTPDYKKLATINHSFGSHSALEPGSKFFGKPVEGWFTHAGKYLWVTYYRWSDDAFAVKDSGFAVIDTDTDKILKAYPTGNIPKFITADPQSGRLAVTLWGDNTVELYDISNPAFVTDLSAHKVGTVAVGPPVHAEPGSDRDRTCGLCLRGTAFLPGTSLLAVARMGGGGLALIDTTTQQVVRNLFQVPQTPRHLQVYGDWLYLSANVSGTVGRIRLADLQKAAVTPGFEPSVESQKVGAGARTLKVAGDKVYVALNGSKEVVSMNLDFTDAQRVAAPAFPVGLDVARGQLAVTSQGRQGVGGHRVWIYALPR